MSYKANGKYIEKKKNIEGFQNNLVIENFENNEICITNESGDKICLDYKFFYMAKKLIESTIPKDKKFDNMNRKDMDNVLIDIETRSINDNVNEEQDPLINYEVISESNL